jgi:hypothetical protein
VLPEAVIDRQIAGQPPVALLGVRGGHGVGPLLAQRLNEPLRLAVGSGRVGPADVPEAQGAAGLGERLGDIGGAVVAHHPPALDALGVEPGDCTTEKDDHRWLLLVPQHLDIGEAGGVINGHVDLVVTDAIGATLLPVAADSVPHLAEPGQSLDVDVDQVTGPLPLVALHRRYGLQVSQTAQSETVQSPGNGGERRLEQPGDVPEVQALVTEVDSLLQLLRIERPPLGAADARSAREAAPPEQ